MAAVMVPAWVLCLDKSMPIWYLMFTFPGWVFCPRKLNPFGNQYHSMCCGTMIELVIGKGRPHELGNCNFYDYGRKMCRLFLQMLSIFLQLEEMLSLIQDFVC